MKLHLLADEAELRLLEIRASVDNLERAILKGQSRRPASDAHLRRSRLPALSGVARALRILADRRETLPPDLLGALEADAP